MTRAEFFNKIGGKRSKALRLSVTVVLDELARALTHGESRVGGHKVDLELPRRESRS